MQSVIDTCILTWAAQLAILTKNTTGSLWAAVGTCSSMRQSVQPSPLRVRVRVYVYTYTTQTEEDSYEWTGGDLVVNTANLSGSLGQSKRSPGPKEAKPLFCKNLRVFSCTALNVASPPTMYTSVAPASTTRRTLSGPVSVAPPAALMCR